MNNITEVVIKLIELIPYIIENIAYGYIFISAYEWVSFKDSENKKYIFIKSIVANFIIVSIYQLVSSRLSPHSVNILLSRIILFLLSGIIGLIIGKVISLKQFNNFLNKLHIGRTTNANIWDDIIEPYTWVRVFMKDGTSYLGQYKYGEAFKSEPIIVLATYQKLNNKSEVVLDFSKNNDEFIMVNTKNFEKIEIMHSKR